MSIIKDLAAALWYEQKDKYMQIDIFQVKKGARILYSISKSYQRVVIENRKSFYKHIFSSN